jgi:sugar phosphate isomerase/epimerase
VIRDLGIAAVDVCVFSGYDHNPPEAVVADPARTADAVGVRVAEHDLEISDVFAVTGDSFEALALNHPDEAVRQESRRQFDAFVEFARRLDAPGMTILPGTPFDGIDENHGLSRAADELGRRAQIAADAGLRLSVEPHVGSIVATPARVLELVERTERVELTLDLSHFAYQGTPAEGCYPLLDHTRHIHLRQARPEVIQARVGEGTIDFPELRDRALATRYDGYFALEYQWEEGWLDFTRVDCITESANLRDLILTN